MISDTLIIGEVNAAIYRDNDYLKAIRLENDQAVDCSRDIAMLLDCHAEKRQIFPPPKDREDLTETLKLWSRRHRVLMLALTGLDVNCSESTRISAIKATDSAFANKDLYQFVQARLLACPCPDGADLQGAITLAENYPVLLALYRQLEQMRSLIEPVNRLLQDLLRFEFDGDYDPNEILRLFVDHGLFVTTVNAVYSNDRDKLENLVFEFSTVPALKVLPRLTHFLTLFKSRLIEQFGIQNRALEINKLDEKKEENDDPIAKAISLWLKESRGKGKYNKRINAAEDSLKAVEKQKDYILDLFKQCKQDKAKQAILDLVQNQRQTGRLQNLCQSLCDLAAKITIMGQGEYALTLYQYAKQAYSKDVVCYTGYAETLRTLGRNEAALTVYAEAKQNFKHNVVCYNGYAETLRALGRNEAALTAYAEAKQNFKHNAVCYTGYAETLRALGQNKAALDAYEQAETKFPYDRVLKNARACLLIEVGSFEQAKALLERERPSTHSDWRDYHVLAMLYFRTGQEFKAEEMFLYGIEHADFSSRHYFNNGLALLSLKQNRPEQALKQINLQEADIIVFPESAVLYAHGLAKTNRLEIAEQLLEQLPRSSANIVQLSDYLKKRYLTADNAMSNEKDVDLLDEKIAMLEFDLILRAA